MRIFAAIFSIIITTVFTWVLNTPLGGLPAFGKLLEPVNGFWANAEAVDKDFSKVFEIRGFNSSGEVWFDDRLVPHIKAENDADLYYIQGYVHASFRLWQMDMQTRAAAGRVSEVVGEKTLKYDQEQRRKGMVYGAEQSLKMMLEDERTREALRSYTEGVNAYINSLSPRDYPLEYKLMGFAPEEWKEINTALLLMYMADDLTGGVNDIEYTRLRTVLSEEEIDFFFPDKNIGSTPVIPVGTDHGFSDDFIGKEIYSDEKKSFPTYNKLYPVGEREDGKGSNNWVLSANKTKSKYPILCNDPHLSLNLPAIWYEVQLTAPGINTYGVSLPGAPGVVIGFNDSISWGFTNNYRDVKDYYAIDKVDKKHYLFEGKEIAFEKRVEVIKVKGGADVLDTVNFTIHGPVIYDENFPLEGMDKPLAMQWMAHRPSNELLSLYKLNRAKNYAEYTAAIQLFTCPAQNFVFADSRGDIAMWGQGQFVDKWKGQGKYIMDGSDSSTLWGEDIKMSDNPKVLNPKQDYLASANQTVTDDKYPYWYNGDFTEYRAWRINEVLEAMKEATVEDMFSLQADEYDILAEGAAPILLKSIDEKYANDEYVKLLKSWDYKYSKDSKAATVFRLWWRSFYLILWKKTKIGTVSGGIYPLPERTIDLLQATDTVFFNDVKTIANLSYLTAKDSLDKLMAKDGIEWYKVKNTTLKHLARLDAFSISALQNGGWGSTVNAMKGNHGPSWRMVVEMKQIPEAYGIYPGGQSGNPGSKYYDYYVDKWTEEQYNKLSFISKGHVAEHMKYKWTFKPEGK